MEDSLNSYHSTEKIPVWKEKSVTNLISSRFTEFEELHQQLKYFFNMISGDKLSQKYANYTLKSVVCHRGAIDGGHYWAMIKEYGQWYKIDD